MQLANSAILPEGRIIATDGEAGYQAQTLAPGVYFWKWIWQYSITFESFTVMTEINRVSEEQMK